MDTEKIDPDWRAVFNEEYAAWTAKSYAVLRAELSDVIAEKSCCVHYDRKVRGRLYQVEVQPLEDTAEYLHVAVSVCASPHGVCQPLSASFIRHTDDRLDA